MAAVQGCIGQLEPVFPGGNPGNLGPDKLDAHGLGPLLRLVKLLALGPNIHVENRNIHIRIMFLGNKRFLDRVHATDRRAVAVTAPQVPGTDTLDKGQPLGMTSIGKTLDLTLKWSGGRGHPLKLDRGDNVRMHAVGILGQGLFTDPAKTRRQDNRTDLQLDFLRLLPEINGMALADRDTDLAGIMGQVQTGRRINIICCRYCLGIINVDGTGYGQSFVIRIHKVLGAVLGTEPAGRTAVRINIAGPLPDFGCEITWFSIQCQKISIGEHLYIWRPTGLYQLRREYSERAVVGREGFIQLGHEPADNRCLLHQIDVVTKFSQVKGSLHSGNTATDDHH